MVFSAQFVVDAYIRTENYCFSVCCCSMIHGETFALKVAKAPVNSGSLLGSEECFLCFQMIGNFYLTDQINNSVPPLNKFVCV